MTSVSSIFFKILKVSSFDKDNLKFKHLDVKVGKIFLLLLISIKKILLLGSSIIFNKALIEFVFKNSMLSIKTNLGFELNEKFYLAKNNGLTDQYLLNLEYHYLVIYLQLHKILYSIKII